MNSVIAYFEQIVRDNPKLASALIVVVVLFIEAVFGVSLGVEATGAAGDVADATGV